MSEEEKPPQFVREPDHKFVQGEKIYVIDPNGFDIYVAEILTYRNGNYSIHYPQYPSDDFTTNDTSRFLVINDANRQIFEDQESIRVGKQLEEEDEKEESSGEPDDPDDADASIGDDDGIE